MLKTLPLFHLLVLIICSSSINGMNFEFRSFESPIASQAQIACQANNIKGNGNYVCTKYGEVVCLFGWKNESSLCSEPICSQKCNSTHGKCTAPNTCTCEVGWESSNCDECVALPGCLHGYCNKPYECKCKPEWKGTFCEEPICKDGCLNGFCSSPQECICKPGWKGEKCDICEKLPGCSKQGICEKPLECNCKEGWKGNFCQIPKCHPLCHSVNGYCFKPNECWCHIGWEGEHCDKCRPYPGCKGKCEKPWECICLPGQSGPLCDLTINSANSTNSTIKSHLDKNSSNEKNTLKLETALLDQTIIEPMSKINESVNMEDSKNKETVISNVR